LRAECWGKWWIWEGVTRCRRRPHSEELQNLFFLLDFFYYGATALVGQGLQIIEDSRIGNDWAGQIMRMEWVEGRTYLVEILIYNNISYNKTNQMHQFLKFILGMKLYIFQTVPLSIIRSFSLCTQQWYMSCRFAESLSMCRFFGMIPFIKNLTGWYKIRERPIFCNFSWYKGMWPNL
jgi:hypothetical protein